MYFFSAWYFLRRASCSVLTFAGSSFAKAVRQQGTSAPAAKAARTTLRTRGDIGITSKSGRAASTRYKPVDGQGKLPVPLQGADRRDVPGLEPYAGAAPRRPDAAPSMR